MTTARPCGRPGCAGTIVDGYCDTCGMAPSKTAPAANGDGQATMATAGPGPVTGRTSGRVDVSRLTTRSTQTGSRSTRRSRVGAGVIEIPPMASADPATVVMADPSVPENRRFCTRCDSPVGRGQGGARAERCAPDHRGGESEGGDAREGGRSSHEGVLRGGAPAGRRAPRRCCSLVSRPAR